MSSHFTNIRAALESTLKTVLDGLSIAIAWENVKYEPTPGTAFARCTLLPADTDQATMGSAGRDRHEGMLQVDVFLPAGKSAVSAVPDQIADALKRGSSHSFGGDTVVSRSASVGAAIRDQISVGSGSSAWYVVPVIIKYYAYTGARS